MLSGTCKFAEAAAGYAMTLAPLVVKDKVIVGVAGGEFGVRGFIAAYDAHTGKQAWRFDTIPEPDRAGSRHLARRRLGARQRRRLDHRFLRPRSQLDLLGHRQSRPGLQPDQRPGDNLYSDSVLALDADTGKLKWYFQFTPHDPYDYDSVQVPVLVNANWNGSPRKLMLWGNRNGFFYVLDRTTGKFLAGRPFVKVNWASGLDANGRPIPTPQPPGAPTYPGIQGGTNWYSPSYSPRTGLFYISTWEDYATIFTGVNADYKEGTRFTGGANTSPVPGAENPTGARQGPVNTYTEALGQRRRRCHRSRDRREEMDVRHARREHQRNSDHRFGPALRRRPGRLFPSARRPNRRAALEGEPGRRNRRRADELPGGRQAVHRHRLG